MRTRSKDRGQSPQQDLFDQPRTEPCATQAVGMPDRQEPSSQRDPSVDVPPSDVSSAQISRMLEPSSTRTLQDADGSPSRIAPSTLQQLRRILQAVHGKHHGTSKPTSTVFPDPSDLGSSGARPCDAAPFGTSGPTPTAPLDSERRTS